MMEPSWRLDDAGSDLVPTATGQPLVSLHFLGSALRRRWRVWAAAGCLGLLLGLAYAILMPVRTVGTASLILAHPAGSDPEREMSTDVSLMQTRTVAARLIDELHLKTTPEAFQRTVTVSPVSTRVLVVNVVAPDRSAAVVRARALSDIYLKFRGEQIEAQSRAMIDGYEARIASLEKQAGNLTQQYNSLSSADGAESRSLAADVLGQRSQAYSQISTTRQQMQETSLDSRSVVAASHVLDPAAAVVHSTKKQFALSMASGLVGGTAVGMGLVVFAAVTSDRLRRRDEVALALGAPVRVSVEGLPGPPRRFRRGQERAWSRDLQILVHALDSAVSPSQPRTSQGARKGRQQKSPVSANTRVRLALGTVESVEAGKRVVAGLAAELAARDRSLFIVDLTEAGGLERDVARALGSDYRPSSDRAPVVFRPKVVPSVARGPLGLPAGRTSDLPPSDPHRRRWDSADVVVTLTEVDPAAGVEHLNSWSEQVVLLVTAGRSSAERLRSTGELIRSAGLELRFAMMVGDDPYDESLGLPYTSDPKRAGDRGRPS